MLIVYRIRDDRLGSSGQSCENGVGDPISVFLRVSPPTLFIFNVTGLGPPLLSHRHQGCLETFPDFLAPSEKSRVISAVQETVEVWRIGLGPGRFWNVFHDFAPVEPETIEEPVENLSEPNSKPHKWLIVVQGQVAEWFKALDSKSSVPSSVPWVRLPPCPPFRENRYFQR
jgi:hypothetical protein